MGSFSDQWSANIANISANIMISEESEGLLIMLDLKVHHNQMDRCSIIKQRCIMGYTWFWSGSGSSKLPFFRCKTYSPPICKNFCSLPTGLCPGVVQSTPDLTRGFYAVSFTPCWEAKATLTSGAAVRLDLPLWHKTHELSCAECREIYRMHSVTKSLTLSWYGV